MSGKACWCGRDHRETNSGDQARDLSNALTTLGHEILAALRIPQVVAALDRPLRRRPWLYARLGGTTSPAEEAER